MIAAEPAPITVRPETAALIIIDMQRDFLEPDVSPLPAAIAPTSRLLDAARRSGLFVIHTREGHRSDLSDAPKAKLERGKPSMRIGDAGPMGRILIRGEAGHDITRELYPLAGEPVIDKPGKGAFYAT